MSVAAAIMLGSLLVAAIAGIIVNALPADVDGCCPHIDPADDEVDR